MPRSSAGALRHDVVVLSVLAPLVAGALTACGASPAERKAEQKAEAAKTLATAMAFHRSAPRFQVSYGGTRVDDDDVVVQRDRRSRSTQATLTDTYELPGTVRLRRIGDDLYVRGDRRFWKSYFPGGDEDDSAVLADTWFASSRKEDPVLDEKLDEQLEIADSVDKVQDLEYRDRRTVDGRSVLQFRSPAVTVAVDAKTRRIAMVQQRFGFARITVSYPKRDVARPADAV